MPVGSQPAIQALRRGLAARKEAGEVQAPSVNTSLVAREMLKRLSQKSTTHNAASQSARLLQARESL